MLYTALTSLVDTGEHSVPWQCAGALPTVGGQCYSTRPCPYPTEMRDADTDVMPCVSGEPARMLTAGRHQGVGKFGIA